nr:IS5 family transposase [Alienimonas californiensis]
MFFSIDLESRIRADHPLRPLKQVVDRILAGMSERFAAAYSRTGRPGVPPERLLKALLLMAIYSVRSERQLVERIDTDLLFRWFLDMDPAEEVFDATAFTHNRSRLDEHGLTAAFFEAVVELAVDAGLVSDAHFTVDGTLIESCASIKSLRPIDERPADSGGDRPGGDRPGGDRPGGDRPGGDRPGGDRPGGDRPGGDRPGGDRPGGDRPGGDRPGGDRPGGGGFKSRNPLVDFRGQKRSNRTHRSATDPEARLYRKAAGQETKLAHLGHSLCENRHGLVVAVEVTEANGTAEREAALAMLDRVRIGGPRGVRSGTLGADRGYDSGPFCLELERRGIEPHVATRRTARDPATVPPSQRAAHAARLRMLARMEGETYAISQRVRKKAEEPFGWMKTIGGLARGRFAGRWKLKQQMETAAAAFNLIRLRTLLPA